MLLPANRNQATQPSIPMTTQDAQIIASAIATDHSRNYTSAATLIRSLRSSATQNHLAIAKLATRKIRSLATR